MKYKSVLDMESEAEFGNLAKEVIKAVNSDLLRMPINYRVDLLLSEIDLLAPRAELNEYAKTLNNYAVAKMIHRAARDLMPLLGLRQTAIECLALIEEAYKEIKDGRKES